MSKYAIVDLEMCRVPMDVSVDDYPYGQEIIQVGVVLLDEKFDKIGEFCSLVKPQFGEVNDYITRLTGITKASTLTARDFRSVITELVEWLPNDVVFVEWSNNDQNQLCTEIEFKGLEEKIYDVFFDEWIDCQLSFSQKLNTQKIYKLSEALSIADIFYDDGAHDALIDAKNTAKLFKKIMTEDKLKLSPYLKVE